jgi:hypothetical protein
MIVPAGTGVPGLTGAMITPGVADVPAVPIDGWLLGFGGPGAGFDGLWTGTAGGMSSFGWPTIGTGFGF